MKAYLVRYEKEPVGCFVVYAARTRSQAKMGLYNSRREHWVDVAYTQIKARRVSQFDAQARELHDLRGPICIGWRGWGESWGVGGQRIDGIDADDQP